MSDNNSFALRSGRMSRAQKRSYENLKSEFLAPFSEKNVDFEAVFGNSGPVIVEIGFGMGLATAEIAEANPGNNYLGIEVFKAGVGKLLWEAERRGLSNLRIIERDAAEVMDAMIKPQSMAGFHVFFPDPWPKKRHHKRRLIKRPFTEKLCAALVPSGYVYMVTDWEDYAKFALDELRLTAGLFNKYENAGLGGFAPRREWRPLTKFEKKGLDKNHSVYELYFIKG
jgi:tRNA (guanine-N7-)-methyltransferase